MINNKGNIVCNTVEGAQFTTKEVFLLRKNKSYDYVLI